MYREVTERHVFLQVEFCIILINISMGGSFDASDFRVKVDNDHCGISISHKEAISTSSYRWSVYGRRTYTMICVGTCFQ